MRPHPIITKRGRRPGELVVHVPPAWELRLRRVVRQLMNGTLADPHEPGLTARQREARIQARRRQLQGALCQFITDLLTAEIVGKEVALASRSRAGVRRGSLREHVQAVLRQAAADERAGRRYGSTS